MKLIENLLRVLFPPRATQSSIAGLTLESLGTYAEPVTFTSRGIEITSLLPYREPLVRALIVEAKFHEHAEAHLQLGALLAEYLLTFQEESPFGTQHYVLVPVPLSKERYRERGYNQVERILVEAKKLLPDNFVLNTHLVRRIRDTAAQTSLGRSARLSNMDAAFTVHGAVEPRATYIVIDDVATTGATINAVAATLRTVGAEHIYLVALAH